MPRNKATVWEEFDFVNEKMVICKHCDKTLVRNATRMSEHIATVSSLIVASQNTYFTEMDYNLRIFQDFVNYSENFISLEILVKKSRVALKYTNNLKYYVSV